MGNNASINQPVILADQNEVYVTFYEKYDLSGRSAKIKYGFYDKTKLDKILSFGVGSVEIPAHTKLTLYGGQYNSNECSNESSVTNTGNTSLKVKNISFPFKSLSVSNAECNTEPENTLEEVSLKNDSIEGFSVNSKSNTSREMLFCLIFLIILVYLALVYFRSE